MKFLLDTDTCVHWLRGAVMVRQQMASIGSNNIGLSVVTLAELRYGAQASSQITVNHRAIDGLMSGLVILGVSPAVARVFGDHKAELRARGLLIEDFDLLIAATALSHNLTLVTGNSSHFERLTQLQLANWVKPAGA